MSKELFVTKISHALSVLGLGNVGKNIIGNLPALKITAVLFLKFYVSPEVTCP